MARIELAVDVGEDFERIIAACHEQLAEHGGAADIGDTALLDSALARPENSAAHGKPDVALLAAAHGFGLVRKHPKLDGNKRAALIATELLLAPNGSDLVVDNAECVLVVVALAPGELAGGGIPCVASRPRRAAPAEKPDQRVSAAFHAATRGSMKRRHSGGSSASSTSEA